MGLVVGTEWDELGNTTDLKISSAGEVDYHVKLDKKGKRLYKYLKRFIEVEGYICNETKLNQITITKYYKITA